MLFNFGKIMKKFIIFAPVILLLFLSFFVRVSKCEDTNSVQFEEKWFEQYLDHFNVWDNRTFNAVDKIMSMRSFFLQFKRYFENNEFFRPNGPLLLQIGAEETIDADSLQTGPSYTLAKRTKGMIVLVEHRYYGSSFPFEDRENATDEDYTYLSVDQALEDLANFIVSYKNMTPGLQNSKVVVFGCSYAASLATWLRYKFPHIVDAAWASSGPLKATLDFHEYYEVANEFYSNISSECIALIRQGYREAKRIMETPEGEESVKSIFEGWECGNVTEMDPDSILGIIRNVVSNQYTDPDDDIKSCAFLQSKNSTTTPFQQLAAFVNSKAKEVCFDDTESDDLGWRYQTCTQFGFICTTSSPKQPFKETKSVIDEEIAECAETFGDGFNIGLLQRGIDRLNRVYGSTNIKVTRVLTVHGTHDPWHKLGLYHQNNDEAPVLLVKGTSHCADVTADDTNIPQLKEAKNKAYKLIEKWIMHS